MNHIFPFTEIEKGSRIILYGASECGYDYYRQIISTGYCEIVLWVDRQYEWWRYLNLPVDDPKSIISVAFDMVVITAENKLVYESMRRDLHNYGVEDSRIFWKENSLIAGNIVTRYSAERVHMEAQEAEMMDGKALLREERLDVVIRSLYAKSIIKNDNNSKYETMYYKLMMTQNNGMEPTEGMISGFFSEYSFKGGWKAFKKSFQELIISMQENGFERDYFIPLDIQGRMINGAHRLAVALALEVPVWVRIYPYEGIRLIFDDIWLYEHGFSEEDIQYIKNVYEELGCIADS